MTQLNGYHGLTMSDAITGAWHSTEMYVAYDRSLAEDAAIRGKVYVVTYEARTALCLRTPESFRDAWIESGAEGIGTREFGACRAALAKWARLQGADAICIPASAFAGELGYEWAASTMGEPQMILLEPGRAVLTPC